MAAPPHPAAFCEAAPPVKPDLVVGLLPFLLLLSGRVRPGSAGALEVPLSLLYALSGNEGLPRRRKWGSEGAAAPTTRRPQRRS